MTPIDAAVLDELREDAPTLDTVREATADADRRIDALWQQVRRR